MEDLETAASLFLLMAPLVITMWWGRKLLRLLPVPILLIMSKSFWADYQIERSPFAIAGIVAMWAMAAYAIWDAKRRRDHTRPGQGQRS